MIFHRIHLLYVLLFLLLFGIGCVVLAFVASPACVVFACLPFAVSGFCACLTRDVAFVAVTCFGF